MHSAAEPVLRKYGYTTQAFPSKSPELRDVLVVVDSPGFSNRTKTLINDLLEAGAMPVGTRLRSTYDLNAIIPLTADEMANIKGKLPEALKPIEWLGKALPSYPRSGKNQEEFLRWLDNPVEPKIPAHYEKPLDVRPAYRKFDSENEKASWPLAFGVEEASKPVDAAFLAYKQALASLWEGHLIPAIREASKSRPVIQVVAWYDDPVALYGMIGHTGQPYNPLPDANWLYSANRTYDKREAELDRIFGGGNPKEKGDR